MVAGASAQLSHEGTPFASKYGFESRWGTPNLTWGFANRRATPNDGSGASDAVRESDRLEWRRCADDRPIALIFRVTAQRPASSTEQVSRLFVVRLAHAHVARAKLSADDKRLEDVKDLLANLNAFIRGVSEGPDAALYVLTDGQDGKILRLVKKS